MDVFFISSNIGWVTGFTGTGFQRKGFLIHTEDGGQSWEKLYEINNYYMFYGLKFSDPQNGLVVANDGIDNFSWSRIYKTNDGGKTLSLLSSSPEACFYKIYTDGTDTIWGTGFGFGLSVNGGKSWTGTNMFPINDSLKCTCCRFLDLLQFDGSRGMACVRNSSARKYLIWYTENSGNDWKEINVPQDFSPSSICKAGSYIIVSGTKGSIITNRPQLSYVTGEQNKNLLSFDLSQNYPNPFNPVTTINYSIPGQSYVELKVYDLLGREVALLVSKDQKAGEYIVHFNASSLPSGIYIYSLHAGQYRASKKLTVMK